MSEYLSFVLSLGMASIFSLPSSPFSLLFSFLSCCAWLCCSALSCSAPSCSALYCFASRPRKGKFSSFGSIASASPAAGFADASASESSDAFEAFAASDASAVSDALGASASPFASVVSQRSTVFGICGCTTPMRTGSSASWPASFFVTPGKTSGTQV